MNDTASSAALRAMTPGDYRYNMLIKRFASLPEPAFETSQQLSKNWGRAWGCGNDVGRLRAVLMHSPGPEMDTVDPAMAIPELGAYGDDASGWYWAGQTVPPMARYREQHACLVAALQEEGVEVFFMESAEPGKTKQVYTRDSVIMLPGGAVVTRLGPLVRRGEELTATRTLARMGVPILRTIHGTGVLEGGSFAFVNATTAVVGLSSRCNEEGARQLEEVLRVHGIELLRVQIPGYRLHIDGAFVMVHKDVALVNPARLPFVFIEALGRLGVHVVEMNSDDPAWGINCLAVQPGRIFVSHTLSDQTLASLRRHDVVARVIPFDAVCLGGGGIHCSTSPLIRDPA